jgi:hypothetical protein
MPICSTITPIWVIFANMSAFPSFFSLWNKRADLLEVMCGRRMPRSSQTGWNVHSRAVNCVHQNKIALLVSIKEWNGLVWFLEYEEFLYFLKCLTDYTTDCHVSQHITERDHNSRLRGNIFKGFAVLSVTSVKNWLTCHLRLWNNLMLLRREKER